MAEQFSQGEAEFGFVSRMSVIGKQLKDLRELRGVGGRNYWGVSRTISAAFGRAGGGEVQKLELFWCLRELFWLVSRDAALWASIYHVKQRYNICGLLS